MELGYIDNNEQRIHINLWVTRECNFACKYCYEDGIKEAAFLTESKADQIIEFIEKLCIQENKKTVWLTFHGGEPMLNTPIIKYVVDKFRDSKVVSKMFTSMTTNCSIYDESILDYLCELTVSIDGTKAAHDRNRVTKTGAGTYDNSIKNALKYLEKHNMVRLRTVVTPNNVSDVSDGVKELLDYGFRTIIPAIDYFDSSWKDEDFDVYYQEILKIKEYITEKNIYDANVSVTNPQIEVRGICQVGCDGYQIDCHGDIYSCTYVVGRKEFCIGNVETGFDQNVIDSINHLCHKNVDACSDCSYYKYCTTSKCLLLNKLLTGDFYSPSPVVCADENIALRIREANE